MHFDALDLRADPQAASFVKHECVAVTFAPAAGQLQSREGVNCYEAGDALVTGSNGDVWSVSRARFDARYETAGAIRHGEDGGYQNKPLPVLARQVNAAFTLRRSAGGDLLHGKAGDWLLQYAAGDYGIVDQEKFGRVYRRLHDN
jgi:PGDYG protein